MNVIARLETRGKVRVWIVDKCPYCGKKHTHGAGFSEGNVDPKEYLGHRVAHCISGEHDRDDSYTLVCE